MCPQSAALTCHAGQLKAKYHNTNGFHNTYGLHGWIAESTISTEHPAFLPLHGATTSRLHQVRMQPECSVCMLQTSCSKVIHALRPCMGILKDLLQARIVDVLTSLNSGVGSAAGGGVHTMLHKDIFLRQLGTTFLWKSSIM